MRLGLTLRRAAALRPLSLVSRLAAALLLGAALAGSLPAPARAQEAPASPLPPRNAYSHLVKRHAETPRATYTLTVTETNLLAPGLVPPATMTYTVAFARGVGFRLEGELTQPGERALLVVHGREAWICGLHEGSSTHRCALTARRLDERTLEELVPRDVLLHILRGTPSDDTPWMLDRATFSAAGAGVWEGRYRGVAGAISGGAAHRLALDASGTLRGWRIEVALGDSVISRVEGVVTGFSTPEALDPALFEKPPEAAALRWAGLVRSHAATSCVALEVEAEVVFRDERADQRPAWTERRERSLHRIVAAPGRRFRFEVTEGRPDWGPGLVVSEGKRAYGCLESREGSRRVPHDCEAHGITDFEIIAAQAESPWVHAVIGLPLDALEDHAWGVGVWTLDADGSYRAAGALPGARAGKEPARLRLDAQGRLVEVTHTTRDDSLTTTTTYRLRSWAEIAEPPPETFRLDPEVHRKKNR